MPEKSSFESPSAVAASVGASSPAPAAVVGNANAAADRIVRRKISDVLGLANSLYAKSPSVLRYGVDQFAWVSRPVLNKVNPLAYALVDRLDDGVDSVTSKLASANHSAVSASSELKLAAVSSLTLVSKQWHASVDAILVPLHPALAANMFVAQSVELFTQLFAGAQPGAAADAKTPEPTAVLFVARLKAQLSHLWDDRLLPLSESFFVAAKARLTASTQSADQALIAIKAALGVAWNTQLLAVFESKVGTPSRELYTKVLQKFVAVWDAKQNDIQSGKEFVQSMKGTLGALWTDKLSDPILQLYTAAKAHALLNAESVRAIAAVLNRDTETAVQTRYTSLYASLSRSVAGASAPVLAALATASNSASHWTLRRVYQSGTELLYTAVDHSVQRTLNVSEAAIDYLLPRGEGEVFAAAPPTSTPAPAPQASSADNKQAVAPAAAPAPRLSLRVLRDRTSQRVRARVSRALRATTAVLERSDAYASKTAAKVASVVGVDVYAQSKEFLARTQKLVSDLALAVDSKHTAIAAHKDAALVRVRTALTGLHTELSKQTAGVGALLSGFETKVGSSALRQSALTAVRARLTAAVQKLQSLAAKAKTASDALLDEELSAFPKDLLRLIRAVPSLLPLPVQSAGASAGAKLSALFAAFVEAVSAVAAYTASFVRRSPASAAAAAATPAATPAPSVSTASVAAAAPAPVTPAVVASAPASDAPAQSSPNKPVKQIAAQYEAAAAVSAKPSPVKANKRKAKETVKSAEEEEDL